MCQPSYSMALGPPTSLASKAAPSALPASRPLSRPALPIYLAPRSSTQGLLLRPCLAFPIFSSQATGSPSSRPLPPTWLSVPREGTVREIAMTQFCFLYFLMFPASLCFSLSPSVSVAWAWQSLSRTLLAPESLLNLQTCN